MSKIEQVIMEIEDYLSECKTLPMSSSKISVNRNDLEEMLEDLKAAIPDEVKKYQRIIANRDAILKDAQDKAEEMIRKANEMTVQLVSEHEIMQQAYKEANELVEKTNAEAQRIIDEAALEANNLKSAANAYLDSSMEDIQQQLMGAIESINSYNAGIVSGLQGSLNVVVKNRESYQADQRHVDMDTKERMERQRIEPQVQQQTQYSAEPAYEARPQYSEQYAQPAVNNMFQDGVDGSMSLEDVLGGDDEIKLM